MPRAVSSNLVIIIGFALIVLTSPVSGQEQQFVRGDATANGIIDIGDPVAMLVDIYLGEDVLECLDAADFDDDGLLDLADAISLLEYLFRGGEEPADPGPQDCGPDPTSDDLDCEQFAICPSPPVAVILATPVEGDAPLLVALDGGDSFDPDGAVLEYLWDFGDGGSDEGVVVSHVYTAIGDYTVTLTVVDNDGITGETTETVSITGLAPFTIESTSPSEGEDGVAVTRETVLRFSGPILESSVTEDAIVVLQGSDLISTSLHTSPISNDPADDGLTDTVTIFYPDGLSASALITVLVDGDELLDMDGRLVDGDGDRVEGGLFTLEFATLSLTPVFGTAVCGRVFATQFDEGPDGEILNIPLDGATISIDGTDVSTTSDELGSFRLDDVPAGRFFVHIDGTTVPAVTIGGEALTLSYPEGPYFPNVGKTWEAVAGEEVQLDNIYLPLVAADALTELTPGEDAEICFELESGDEICVTVPADALYANDGTVGGSVGIATVDPSRLPGQPPTGLDFARVITVQTDGATNFDLPVAVCFPNEPDPQTGVELDPGDETSLWSFNHDTGAWEIVATMIVSDDGMQICTVEGEGILAPGWHAIQPGSIVCCGEIRKCEVDCDDREDPPQNPVPDLAADECDAPGTCSIGGKVYLHSGEETFERVDLVIPGRAGMDFVLSRRYRSQWPHDGPMGYGWDFSYNEGLYPQADGSTLRLNGRGRVTPWDKQDGEFTTPTGYFYDLDQSDNGDFEIVDRGGFRRIYHPDGRLQAYEDRFGNRMAFAYDVRGNLDMVVDTYGREIRFFFEPRAGRDRLVRVRDFIGREVLYRYDDSGNLIEATSPRVLGTPTDNDFPLGRTERYTYSSGFAEPELNHNILSITSPEEVALGGPPTVSWEYGEDPDDPVTFDRVLSEHLGGGNVNGSGVPAGGTMTFEYEMLNEEEPPGQLALPRGSVLVTERNGNQFRYFVNELNHHIITRRFTRGLREEEPEYFETVNEFDADGQLLRRTYPEGNSTEWGYASDGPRRSQANEVIVREVADVDRGGGEDLVSTQVIEPIYNQVIAATDPRGNATNFDPPIGVASADRYTTRTYLDYMEGTPQDILDLASYLGVDLDPDGEGPGTALEVAAGLSYDQDLNGDGRTDQQYGNVVRIEDPSVTLRADSKEAERLGSTTQLIVTEFQWNDHGQQLASIDSEGNVIEYDYYPENDPDGDGEPVFSMFFPLSDEPAGYLSHVTIDARTSPRRTTAEDPLQLATHFGYDRVGNRTSIRDPRGIVRTTEFNTLDEPVRIVLASDVQQAVLDGHLPEGTEPLAYESKIYYDHNGRVVRREVENRDLTTPGVGSFVEQTHSYDILGNLVTSTREVDGETTLTWQFRYDEEELPTSTIQPEGNETRVTFDERNLPFLATRGFNTAEESTVRVDYDQNGNHLEIFDAADNDDTEGTESARFGYDGFDRLVITTDALGNELRNTYDLNSNLIREEVFGHPADEPSGDAVLLSDVSHAFDELDRLFRTDEQLFLSSGFTTERSVQLNDADDDGAVTEFMEYDALSRMTFLAEDDGEIQSFEFDGVSRVVATTDAVGNRSTLEYDAGSNPIRVTVAEQSSDGIVPEEQYVTHYVWDQLDRLVRITDNLGHTTRYTYDSRGNVLTRTDPSGAAAADPLGLFVGDINGPGNSCAWVYDGLDRRLSESCDLRVGGLGDGELDTSNPSNTDGQVTVTTTWDGNSRIVERIDDEGRTTSYEYDALDRLTAKELDDGSTYSYVYDADHNVLERTDPNGTVTVWAYDALNRRVAATVTRAADVLGTTSCEYGFDGLSRLTSTSDDNGGDEQTCEFVYDSLGRLLEERQNSKAVSTVWSGDSKILSVTYPGGRTLSYTHDAIDRVVEIAEGSTTLVQSLWIGDDDRELERSYGNGTRATMLNDAGDVSVGWDGIQRLSRIRHLASDDTVLVDREYGYNRASIRVSERRNEDFGLTDNYTYDSLYRLVRVELDQDGEPGSTGRDLLTRDYQYDGVGNRLEVTEDSLSVGEQTVDYVVNSVNAYAEVDGTSRTHDSNGNLTDDGEQTYHYDYLDRLVEVRDSSDRPIAEYRYFEDGRRARKIVHDPSTGTVTKDESYYYDELEVCEERDTASDAVTATYVWDPTRLDGLFQITRREDDQDVVYYAHEDARLSIVALTDADGEVVQTVLYDDFGIAEQTGEVTNPYLFQGRRLDEESGLYYYRHRYYDPRQGRFLQRDDVWDESNTGNQYSFAGCSPISGSDPLGLECGPVDCSKLAKAYHDAMQKSFDLDNALDDRKEAFNRYVKQFDDLVKRSKVARGKLDDHTVLKLVGDMIWTATPGSTEIDFVTSPDIEGGIALARDHGGAAAIDALGDNQIRKKCGKPIKGLTKSNVAAVVTQWLFSIGEHVMVEDDLQDISALADLALKNQGKLLDLVSKQEAALRKQLKAARAEEEALAAKLKECQARAMRSLLKEVARKKAQKEKAEARAKARRKAAAKAKAEREAARKKKGRKKKRFYPGKGRKGISAAKPKVKKNKKKRKHRKRSRYARRHGL